jgi:hypothetical protein
LDTAEDRPIILLGCPRSGTTLLQLMLHRHPRIAIPPETRFLLPAYESRLEFGDLQVAENRRALGRWIVDRKATRFDELGLDADDIVAEIVDGPPTLGSAFAIVFRAYARRFGKPRWGDKRPGYYQHVDVIRRLFPTAQFVHIVRDGRDSIASLTDVPWWKQGFPAAVSTWAQAIDDMRWAAMRLPEDTYHELRYEALVTDPASELKRLCGFLGEEYDAAMTEPEALASVAVPHRKKWHAMTSLPVTADHVGIWRERLTGEQASLCEAMLGPRLRAHGYDLSALPRPTVAAVVEYRKVAARRRLAALKHRLIDRRKRMSELGPVAARSLS